MSKQWWVALLMLFVGERAFAERPVFVDPSVREENFQRQQQLQNKINQELEESHRKQKSPLPMLLPLSPEAELGVGKVYLVSVIDVDAGVNKPFVEVNDIISTYVGTKIGSLELFNLVREVTNRYIEKGYSTTTITVAPSNLQKGEVRLLVRWGLVQEWLFDGRPASTWKERWMAKTLLPGIIGQPLNIHAVDQAIENLNNGVKSARVDIIAGARMGYSSLNIIQAPGAPKFNAGVNNQNADTTSNGRYQFTVGASLGDVVLPNDKLSVNGGSRYYNESFGNDEYTAGFNYAIPVGFSEVSLRYSGTNYHKEILGTHDSYGSSGDSETFGLRYAHTVWRDRASKVSLFSELEFKNSANYIDDYLLSVNSKPYRSLAVGGQYVSSLAGGSIFSDLTYSQGLKEFGGTPAAVDNYGRPKNFKRAQSNITWTRPFNFLEFPLEYSLRLNGQYSMDSMVSTYKIGIGDEYTVRGYKGTPAWGDKGMSVSNTLTHTIPFDDCFGSGSLAVYGGVDWGRVKEVSYSHGSNIDLSGAVAGLRSNWKYFSLSLGVGVPLKKIRGVDIPSEAIYLNMTGSY